MDLIERLVIIDTLLKLGFSPVRIVVIAFGFDEEVTGQQGAGHIATYLEETYGHDGFTMILNEGGGGDWLIRLFLMSTHFPHHKPETLEMSSTLLFLGCPKRDTWMYAWKSLLLAATRVYLQTIQ